MEIKNLFHRNERLRVGKLVTLEQAKKYEQDKKYKDCIFPVEGIIGGKIMCRMQKSTKKRRSLELKQKGTKSKFSRIYYRWRKIQGK